MFGFTEPSYNSPINHTGNLTQNQLTNWVIFSTTLSLWFWCMVLLSLAGGISNGGLMFLILNTKKLRSGSGFLIAHLLFVDGTLCLVHELILTISTYYFAPYAPLNDTFCRYTVFAFYTTINAANWTSLLIGVNRYIAIFYPHKYYLWSRKSVIISMMLTAWTVGIGCNLLGVFEIAAYFTPTRPWGTCGVIFIRKDLYQGFSTVGFTGPLLIVGGIYLYTMITVRCSSLNGQVMDQKVAAECNLRANMVFRRRYRSAVMLFVSHIWYFVCLMPAPLASTLYPAEYTSNALLSLVLRVLMLFGYATIPVSEAALSEDYGRNCINVLFRTDRWNTL